MTGADILVILMGVIAGGVGLFCFVSEHFENDREAENETEKREGGSK